MEEKHLSQKTFRNSVYNFSSNIIAKIGGLVLTIVLARMLMPELFGIYHLVLSIVLVVFTFTDLGINSAVYRYLSFALKTKNRKKARSYLRYLLKIKGVLLLFAIILMFILAPVLSTKVYNNTLLLIPLLFATCYIFINAFRSFFEGIYFPTKDLRKYPLTTFILHSLRVILSIIVLFIVAKENAVSAIFIAFALASFLSLIAIFIVMGKNRDLVFGKTEKIKKIAVNKYIGFMSIASLSLIFFGSVDTLMLGYFVDANYLGFYRAALGLIVSIAAALSLSNIFLPIFTQAKKTRLDYVFEEGFRYVCLITIPAAFGLIFIGKKAIEIIYGSEYLNAILPLYALSFLIIIIPLIKMHSSLFESREKTKLLALFTILSLIINIILNYLLINFFLIFGQDKAIFGAGLATLTSQIFYLSFLNIKAKPEFKVKSPLRYVAKPFFSAILMSIVLLLYNTFLKINILTFILEIILGAAVYFFIMYSIEGIDKKDINLFRNFFKKNKDS